MGSCEVGEFLSSDGVEDVSIRELREKHWLDLENLTLTTQPLKTLHLFTLATSLYLKRSLVYILSKGRPLMLLCILLVACGFVLMAIDGPHMQRAEEITRYFTFGLWWVALGVASSMGLGSGLHTFVIYLGPHIALFTIKATQCGRVDLKSAPYDTIQMKSAPSWLGKDCSRFGPPVFQSIPGSLVRVPLMSILWNVQLEAILWGLGTALGELPPYFISRAARISGSKFDALEDQTPGRLNQIKIWLLSRSQYLNIFPLFWCLLRFQTHYLILLVLCVGNLEYHSGNFSLQH
ncbi:hypothetical protein QJS10_CPA10g00228 [Acorus calamus]|uniref:Vacuole membrane protein KMS1 n=1 Tax=Acorus calamus TaxID=4465 RepID=A0AAV9E0B4_ACOCL|nr:hypothetical protein QJS10_CPA10g00228 [Acorus calamus]